MLISFGFTPTSSQQYRSSGKHHPPRQTKEHQANRNLLPAYKLPDNKSAADQITKVG